MKKLIIFDLDGTLLNTIADLAHSTNHALQTLGYPTHEVASYNFMVGNGINKLFERALPEGEKTEEIADRRGKGDGHHGQDGRHPGPLLRIGKLGGQSAFARGDHCQGYGIEKIEDE